MMSDCGTHELYIIIANISKRPNIRSMIASASAFGADVLVVKQPKFSLDTHVPPNVPSSVNIRRFDTLRDCCDFVHSRGGAVIGVEIVDGAKNLDEDPFPFSGTCAVMMGNEGTGMSLQQKEQCDDFCYMSQHGGGTASLNVAVAAAIALHRFSLAREQPCGRGIRGMLPALERRPEPMARTDLGSGTERFTEAGEG
ncbi:unnamed protein product [Discosporangium mesarthrocarpum]